MNHRLEKRGTGRNLHSNREHKKLKKSKIINVAIHIRHFELKTKRQNGNSGFGRKKGMYTKSRGWYGVLTRGITK